MPPWLFRRIWNLWPPFWGAGIVVTHLSDDWRYARVELRERLLNRNYVRTHFGGSMYAMTDPFYMLLMMRQLGSAYYVWDKSASISYESPGRGVLIAEFRVEDEVVERVRREAASGAAVYPEFHTDILDASGKVIARVHKTLYVRLKPAHRPQNQTNNG